MRLEGSYAFDATLRETPTNLPKLPKLRNMRKVRNIMRVGGGRAKPSSLFLGIKIPRQQSPPTYKLCPAVFTLAAQHAPRLIN